MALPKSYLTSTKNLGAILEAMQQAKAPERFTTRFLESLEFKASADRLIIGVLKSLGLLDDQGKPTQRYFVFLDQTQSAAVLAQCIQSAYADLFNVNMNAQTLNKADLINKFKTLSQGSLSESVLDKMAATFSALVKLADFSAPTPASTVRQSEVADDMTTEHVSGNSDDLDERHSQAAPRPPRAQGNMIRNLGGLHYNIQIVLPETRDAQVYDVLFRSLREHLSL